MVFLREASPNQVSFGGVVKGESAMKTEEEIGGLINYTFRVSLFTSPASVYYSESVAIIKCDSV